MKHNRGHVDRGDMINGPFRQMEWLGLKELTRYAALSGRTIRNWINSPVDPLPAVKVCGKVLVRRSDFDRYLERHPIKTLGTVDVDGIVRDDLEGVDDGR